MVYYLISENSRNQKSVYVTTAGKRKYQELRFYTKNKIQASCFSISGDYFSFYVKSI